MALRGLAKKQATTEGELRALRDYLQQLSGIDAPRPPVSVTFPAGVQVVAAAHGLGRAYVGAYCVGLNHAANPFALTPEGASRVGVDIGVYAVFVLSASVGVDVTANFRVF